MGVAKGYTNIQVKVAPWLRKKIEAHIALRHITVTDLLHQIVEKHLPTFHHVVRPYGTHLTETVTFHVTTAYRAELRALAKGGGTTLASMIRGLLTKEFPYGMDDFLTEDKRHLGSRRRGPAQRRRRKS
jgi:hypothetical protein